jgi:hypothetical protein
MEGTGMKNAAVRRSHRQSGPRREDPLHTVIIWRCFLPPFPWLWGNDTAVWNGRRSIEIYIGIHIPGRW